MHTSYTCLNILVKHLKKQRILDKKCFSCPLPLCRGCLFYLLMVVLVLFGSVCILLTFNFQIFVLVFLLWRCWSRCNRFCLNVLGSLGYILCSSRHKVNLKKSRRKSDSSWYFLSVFHLRKHFGCTIISHSSAYILNNCVQSFASSCKVRINEENVYPWTSHILPFADQMYQVLGASE